MVKSVYVLNYLLMKKWNDSRISDRDRTGVLMGRALNQLHLSDLRESVYLID